jgi:hypothetical protein
MRINANAVVITAAVLAALAGPVAYAYAEGSSSTAPGNAPRSGQGGMMGPEMMGDMAGMSKMMSQMSEMMETCNAMMKSAQHTHPETPSKGDQR